MTVHRVDVDVGSRVSKVRASLRLVTACCGRRGACDVVHIHGFSQKNVPTTVLARLLGKPLVLTLHTSGQDEPQAVRRRGRLAYWAFNRPPISCSASAQPSASAIAKPSWPGEAGDADAERHRHEALPSGRPMPSGSRSGDALGWPDTQPVVLFVGFFSRDKRPDLLFRAWRRLAVRATSAPKLVYRRRHGYGILRDRRVSRAGFARKQPRCGRAGDVVFVEPTNEVERYFRAADVFVLPSVREAHPLALLEAMACGLPSIATRLPGATDVDSSRTASNGRLVRSDDERGARRGAVRGCWPISARRVGDGRSRAGDRLARYDISETAGQWLAAYHTVLARIIDDLDDSRAPTTVRSSRCASNTSS